MHIRFGVFFLATLGCTELPGIDRLRCGNGLVEQQVDEDCDGLPAGSPYACGPVGGPDACRFTCETADCPPGWACGDDMICRAPTGSFVRGDVTAMPGDMLALGDLDGDGALDAVSLSENELLLAFGGEGRFGDVRQLRTPPMETAPIVTDVDDDGHADVVFLSSASLTVLRGQDSRALAPILVPSRTDVPLASGLSSIRIDGDESVVILRPQGQATQLQLADRDLDASVIQAELGDGRLNPPTVGQLDTDPLSAQEMIWTRTGATSALVTWIECAPDCVMRVRNTLELPDRLRFGAHAPLIGDLNADGYPDVLAIGEDMNERNTLVAWGSAGGLAPLVVEPAFAQAAGSLSNGPLATFGVAQQLADVVGDARPDIITGIQVFEISGPNDAPELIVRHTQVEPLNLTKAVDIDGNGVLDVIGFGAGQLVYLLSDGRRFTTVSTPFNDGAEPALGDFDGDGRIDLARWNTDGQVEIAFGAPEGLPADPVVVGRFEAARLEMTVTQQIYPYSGVLDRPDELAILADDAYTVLFGNSGRLPTSFVGVAPPAQRISPAILLAGGYFTGPDHEIIVYLANGRTAIPYIARSNALAASAFQQFDPSDCTGSIGLDHHALTIAGADGDELIFIESRRAMPGDLVSWSAQRLRFDDTGGRCVWTGTATNTNQPVNLLADDIDGDDLLDVMTLLAPQRTPIPGLQTAGARLAIWRGADFESGGEAIQQVVQPVATAATTLRLSGTSTVLTFGNGRAWRLTWNGTDFDVFDSFAVPRDIRAAQAADLTGDGIDDLVLKTDTGLVVYRQTTCSARQAWQGECNRPPLP